MASRVVMPKLTDTMEEGVVVTWKKHEGDAVAAGDVLAEIETDKAVMDLEAFASGILRKVLANEGETVKAGALIGVIAEADEDISAETTGASTTAPTPPPSTSKTRPAGPKEPPSAAISQGDKNKTVAPGPTSGVAPKTQTGPKDSSPTQQQERISASPRAKALASERGVELSTLKGTGPAGRIVEDDVLKAGRLSEVAPSAGTDQPLSQMRKAIARATIQSKAPVPHFYLTMDIDMAGAEQLRKQVKQIRQTHPSVTDLLIKAAAQALTRHPEINVSYTGEVIRRHATIDIGIAVGMEDGLITPVLRDCGPKTLEQISAESKSLIERARNKRLRPEEYTGATFTISNLGMFDVESFIAVLMPPEAAALAVGAICDVPVVENGTVKAGRRMKVTMSCDHRALDGTQGAQFLKEFKRILEHPLELILPKEST